MSLVLHFFCLKSHPALFFSFLLYFLPPIKFSLISNLGIMSLSSTAFSPTNTCFWTLMFQHKHLIKIFSKSQNYHKVHLWQKPPNQSSETLKISVSPDVLPDVPLTKGNTVRITGMISSWSKRSLDIQSPGLRLFDLSVEGQFVFM